MLAKIHSVMKTVMPMKGNFIYWETSLEVGEGMKGNLRFTSGRN